MLIEAIDWDSVQEINFVIKDNGNILTCLPVAGMHM